MKTLLSVLSPTVNYSIPSPDSGTQAEACELPKDLFEARPGSNIQCLNYDQGSDGKPNKLGVLEDFPEVLRQRAYDKSVNDGLSADDFVGMPDMMLKSMRVGERERDELNKVLYLTKEQRENYELRARGGQLFRKDGITPLDTQRFYGDHSFLFVISKKGTIYAARGSYHKVHHSSFLAGKDVIAAGKIKTRNGKVIHVSNNSGHYRPRAHHLLQAVHYFHDLGVLSPETKIDLRKKGVFSLKEGVNQLKLAILEEGAS